MGGFFGTIGKTACRADLFYGTDYNSHLGTRRGGMVTYDEALGFRRSIHNLESTYFRTKFENELDKEDYETEELSNELIKKVLHIMISLSENLEDKGLTQSLKGCAEAVLEKIALEEGKSEIF